MDVVLTNESLKKNLTEDKEKGFVGDKNPGEMFGLFYLTYC